MNADMVNSMSITATLHWNGNRDQADVASEIIRVMNIFGLIFSKFDINQVDQETQG